MEQLVAFHLDVVFDWYVFNLRFCQEYLVLLSYEVFHCLFGFVVYFLRGSVDDLIALLFDLDIVDEGQPDFFFEIAY